MPWRRYDERTTPTPARPRPGGWPAPAQARALAPELLQAAKTQRWTPEEVLRALVEAEVAARDAANEQARLRQAHFPVAKTLEEFQLAQSAVPPATFAYLSSMEWLRAAENLCLVGPAGTGNTIPTNAPTGPNCSRR